MEKDIQTRAERLAAAEEFFKQRDEERANKNLVEGVDYLNPVCMNRGRPFFRDTGLPAPLPENWQELERQNLVFQGLIPKRYLRPTDKINPQKPPTP
jgi:hypothetical protein